MFKDILVPLDGSELAERVMHRVAPWRAPGSTLHLARVIPAAGADVTPFDEVLTMEARSYLGFLGSEAGGAVRTDVRRGEVADEVLAAAKAANADLIALSSHGESGVTRFVFGSVAERVVRSSACPVIVFSGVPAKNAPGRPERMIVALDGTPASEASLAPAKQLAKAHEMTMILVHVVESLWAAGDSALARVQAKDAKKVNERVEQVAAQLQAEGFAARPLMARGDHATELLLQIERRKADIVCMATMARSGVNRWFFGSVAEKILKASPVPVLLVRKA